MIFLLTSFITNFQDQIRPSKKYRGGCAILWAYKVVNVITLATHLTSEQDSFYVTQKTCPNILHFKSWANYETFVQSLNTCVTVF